MQRAENFSLRLFVALLIVSGLLWGLDKLGWAKPIKAMLEFGVAPFRSGFADAGAGAAQLVTPLKYSFGGARKVADLERQVAALSVDASKAVLLAQENEALRKIVGANKRGEKQLEPFRVIGRGEEWIISGGKQQGVQTGQVVVSSEGAMVGVVVNTDDFVSRVRIISDPQSKIAAQTEQGALGVVSSSGEVVIFGEVLQKEALEPGMRVVTREGGVVIGEVQSVQVIASEVYKSAVVKPLYDPQGRYVFVIK